MDESIVETSEDAGDSENQLSYLRSVFGLCGICAPAGRGGGKLKFSTISHLGPQRDVFLGRACFGRGHGCFWCSSAAFVLQVLLLERLGIAVVVLQMWLRIYLFRECVLT